MTNNKLKNKPQTSTVFYLAQRNYSSAQSICNWHRLNKKLQPLKALFIISCKSADFTVNYSDKGLQTINTAHRITAGLAASSEGRIRKLTTWRPFSRDTPPTPDPDIAHSQHPKFPFQSLSLSPLIFLNRGTILNKENYFKEGKVSP